MKSWSNRRSTSSAPSINSARLEIIEKIQHVEDPVEIMARICAGSSMKSDLASWV